MPRAAVAMIMVGLLCAPGAWAGTTRTADAKANYQVEQLVAMSPAARREALKKMDPKERRGLWFQVRRTLAERNGVKPSLKGEGPYRAGKSHPVTQKVQPKASRLVGSIVYDSGYPTIAFGGGELVGNRFNTHTGLPVLNSGTLSTVQALVVPGPANTTSSAGFVVEGPLTTMGGALAVFSTFTVATGVIDSLSLTGLGAGYTGSSFMVIWGDFASVYIPAFGTGSTMGQGHHGLVGYTGGMGPNITGTFNFGGALNATVRARGNIVPVELMKFEVE